VYPIIDPFSWYDDFPTLRRRKRNYQGFITVYPTSSYTPLNPSIRNLTVDQVEHLFATHRRSIPRYVNNDAAYYTQQNNERKINPPINFAYVNRGLTQEDASTVEDELSQN
jgi:hypothetical protein